MGTLLGPVEAWALWLGIQGRESVAELVPDFLVKPLILLMAYFRCFQVAVLGPLCHQLWAVHTPAAHCRAEQGGVPLATLSSFPSTGLWQETEWTVLVPVWSTSWGRRERSELSESTFILTERRVLEGITRAFNLQRTFTRN